MWHERSYLHVGAWAVSDASNGEDGIGLASPHGLSGGVSGLMVFTVEDTVDVENI